MPITIFDIYIVIVVDKIFFSCIVRWVYIDNINFAGVSIGKG